MPSLKAIFYREIMRWRAADLDPVRDVDKIRTGLDNMAKDSHAPAGTRKERISINGINAEWITPPDALPNGVMLYLHGGAYIAGSFKSHSDLVAYFAKNARVRALIIEYRLAPEHPFPAALEDAVASYRWLLDNGTRPQDIVIAGDSAGGGLTLATLLKLRDDGLPMPAAAVCISPWTDLAGTGESLRTRSRKDPWLKSASVAPGAALYHGTYPANHPLVSPLYGDLHGLPPILIHVGDWEILLDDAVRMAEKIRQAGGTVELEIWPGMWHVFHAFRALTPESKDANEKMACFIQQHIHQEQPVAAR
jgi:epsilon-lactone hydrolase